MIHHIVVRMCPSACIYMCVCVRACLSHSLLQRFSTPTVTSALSISTGGASSSMGTESSPTSHRKRYAIMAFGVMCSSSRPVHVTAPCAYSESRSCVSIVTRCHTTARHGGGRHDRRDARTAGWEDVFVRASKK